MALIKCTECGHEVSDKASMCPNCGCPIESLGAAQEEVIYEEPKKKEGWIWALIVALLCLIGGGGYYAYSKFDDVGSDKDAIVELTPEFIKAIEKYDQLGIFSEGYAAVRKGNKWGYINAKGEEVIPVNIDAHCVGRFSEGLAFVAHGTMENAEFSVIDKKGNVVFKKNGFNWDSEYSESHDMPYFIEGKIYLPTFDYKHDVYDKKGNKLETISWEEKDSIQKISVKSSNAVFVEETNGVGEVEDYVCRKKYGVKDSVGKVLISAKYDEMAYDRDKDNTDRPFSSNGVILVVLEEPEEGHYTDGTVYDPSIRHYGYVDLKGNDTFSEELKARCLKAETKAMDNYRTYLDSLEQRKEGPDWLQGAWRLELTDDYGNHLGYMYEVFNHGSSKSYIDNRLLLEHNYTVSDDMIMYDKGHYQLDNLRQIVLGANGKEMQKISDDPYYTPNSSSSQSSSSSYSNNSSSSSKGYRFSSPQDVIGWLADKSFYNGNRRLRIRPEGVWLNDYCATGAPNVERWESWKALIQAYTATGERLSFFVDPINGTVTDEASDVFRLR